MRRGRELEVVWYDGENGKYVIGRFLCVHTTRAISAFTSSHSGQCTRTTQYDAIMEIVVFIT